MAKIIVMFRDKKVKEVAIGPQGVRIGRDPGNDIQIDNVAVSRFHAEVYRQNYPFYIEDKKSTNGTYLNGTFVNWKRALNNNDKITIGKHVLIFVEEARDGLGVEAPSPDVTETFCLSPDELARLRDKG